MGMSKGLKKENNIQANRFRLSMIKEEVSIEIMRRLELQQGTIGTHFLESQGQA